MAGNVGRANEEVHGKLLDEVDRLEKKCARLIVALQGLLDFIECEPGSEIGAQDTARAALAEVRT
jgi:hypothetical protein